MPTPNPGESRADFVDRCIPIVIDEGTAEDGAQAAAICHSMFDQKALIRRPGGAVKAISRTEDQLVVENHIILFGGRDLEGEYFDPEVDPESDYTRSVGRLPIDFEHGFKNDGPQGPGPHDVLGYTDWSTARRTDLGWLVQSILDRRNKYVRAFEPLIDAGMMGSSSQAVAELVEKSADGGITRWPLMRNALAVTPIEPRMLGPNTIQAIKSLCELSPDFARAAGPVVETARETVDSNPAAGKSGACTVQFTPEEKNTMGELITTPAAEPQADPIEDRFKALDTRLTALGGQVEKLLDYLESSPAAAKAGIVAPGGGPLAKDNKSFGDFLIAVRFGDLARLKSVYKTGVDSKAFAAKDISGTQGSTAGVLVPEQYTADLLKIDPMTSPALSMIQTIPVGGDHGTWPALDNYITPTAGSGQTAAAAGITVGNLAAGQEFPESTPGFKQLKWLISKVGGTVDVENEVMDDSPFAIEALLRALFRIAVQAKNERNVFRGLGVGEPLGILNSPCAIPIDPDADNTFAYSDALEMLSRFKPVSGRAAWFIHQSIWPDIGVFESSAGGGVWQSNYQGPMGNGLLGYPIYSSEHLPQANSSGCVLLADMFAYIMWQRSVLAVAYSEHAKFEFDMGVWRFSQRNDGKPWLQNVITLADPGGSYTISPFIYLND